MSAQKQSGLVIWANVLYDPFVREKLQSISNILSAVLGTCTQSRSQEWKPGNLSSQSSTNELVESVVMSEWRMNIDLPLIFYMHLILSNKKNKEKEKALAWFL